jgi:hypothetical protein
MSDLNLLLFGCAVSFVVFGGAYIFVREAFVRQEDERSLKARCDEGSELKNREAV